MIGQAICTAGFLVLMAAGLGAAQYCFNRHWMAPSMGLVFIAAMFGVSAMVTLIMLGTQVWQ